MLQKIFIFVFILFSLSQTKSFSQEINEIQKILASDGANYDEFGSSLAINNDYIIVGAPNKETLAGIDAGAAYIYHFNGTEWEEESELIPDDQAQNDYFGCSVGISGDIALVGAYYDDDNGQNSGSVYVFHNTGTEWEQVTKLAPTGTTWFGYSLDFKDNKAVIGAYYSDVNGHANMGKVYIYNYDGTNWTQEAVIIPNDGADNYYFGENVAIKDNNIIVGANINNTDGAAYIFRFDGSNWNQTAKLTYPGKSKSGVSFGRGVSIYNDFAVVGAPFSDSYRGRAYIYHYNGTNWTLYTELIPDEEEDYGIFGLDVCISGNNILIGACETGNDYTYQGATYYYHYSDNTWSKISKFTPADVKDDDEFGYSIFIDGQNAVISSYYDDNEENGVGDAGSVSVYKINESISVQSIPEQNIKIYPNPTTGILNIVLSENEETLITLLSETGKIIDRFNYPETHQIDLSVQSTGIYFLKIENNQISKTIKLVKK